MVCLKCRAMSAAKTLEIAGMARLVPSVLQLELFKLQKSSQASQLHNLVAPSTTPISPAPARTLHRCFRTRNSD